MLLFCFSVDLVRVLLGWFQEYFANILLVRIIANENMLPCSDVSAFFLCIRLVFLMCYGNIWAESVLEALLADTHTHSSSVSQKMFFSIPKKSRGFQIG